MKKSHHPHARRRRGRGALALIVVLTGVLAFAFFRIQVLASGSYKLRAESNRLRPLPVPAPRGTIFDRNGRVVADNVPGYAVTLLPGPLDSLKSTLERLRRYMEIPEERMEALLATARRAPRQPLVVDLDADFRSVSAVEARRHEFSNLFVEMRPKRRYPAGRATAHVTGYVGEVTAEELQGPRFPEDRYEQGMLVGKTGVELQYEDVLQGRRGVRLVEVDARGRIVGDFGGTTSRPRVPGRDIHLNVDVELQEWIHRIFPDTMMGSVVALDPADGGVLALYSSPAYDPNDFVGGIDRELWSRLNTDERKPLYNRAVLGLYPPASTWKLATAAIALDLGAVTPGQTMPVACTGGMSYGGRYWRCWDPEGHGSLDLMGAIQNSCDVYFYQLGLEVGLDRLLREATDIGFSRSCGIDLPEEKRGIFPRDRSYWEDVWGYEAREGEVLSLAIGQGPNSQTPLKMAQFYVALARDGSAPAPRLIVDTAGVAAPPSEGWELNLSEEDLAALREGLRRVTGPDGTAYLSSLEHWDLMGKTGTGQNNLSLRGLAEDHAWFAGMAGPPGEAPEIVVVALVEYGGGGSAVAAPIVAKTADFHLRRKYGIPVDTIQTLREHVFTTGWPEWARPPGDDEP